MGRGSGELVVAAVMPDARLMTLAWGVLVDRVGYTLPGLHSHDAMSILKPLHCGRGGTFCWIRTLRLILVPCAPRGGICACIPAFKLSIMLFVIDA